LGRAGSGLFEKSLLPGKIAVQYGTRQVAGNPDPADNKKEEM